MSRDIGMGRTCGLRFGSFIGGSGWSAGGLVVASGVDGQLAQDCSGGGVDDGDVEVLDEQDDVGSGVGSADADVAESAGDAQGDAAGFVDLVVSGAVVAVGAAVAGGGGFGQRCVDRGGGGLVR